MCSSCRGVMCVQACLVAHWGAHKGDCYYAMKASVDACDVHHEDAGGEYVLVDAVQEYTLAHGVLGERTLSC
jgi:hypothetical protein